ncbi:MAG: hypothetical protein HXY20_06980 [Acidobacteria bacterium]|nr:hypothetical protein [Acidobacteriota bacterium]
MAAVIAVLSLVCLSHAGQIVATGHCFVTILSVAVNGRQTGAPPSGYGPRQEQVDRQRRTAFGHEEKMFPAVIFQIHDVSGNRLPSPGRPVRTQQ